MPGNVVSSRCPTIHWDQRKQNIGYTLCIYATFISLGAVRGLLGHTMYDHVAITGVDTFKALWFELAFFIGSAIGALAGGVFYDRFNRNLVFGPCVLVLACTLVINTWCTGYWTMITAHCIQGIVHAVLTIAGNAEILSMWRDNRSSFLILELLYRFGRFISPQIVKPFLFHYSDINHINSDTNIESTSPIPVEYFRSTAASGPMSTETITYTNRVVDDSSVTSRLYIPYSIIAGCIVVVAVFILPLSCVYKKSASTVNASNYERSQDQSRKLSLITKITALLIMSGSLLLFTGCTEQVSFLYYFGHFQDLNLYDVYDKLSLAVGGVGIISVVVALFLSCLNTMVFARMHCLGMVLSLLALLVSALATNVVGVCISVVVFGYFQGVFMSLLYTWTNEHITPVTGKIASLFLMASLIGDVVGVILMHTLIIINNMWFCYLILIESILLLFLYIIAVLITRHITRKYRGTYSNPSCNYDHEDVLEQFVTSEH